MAKGPIDGEMMRRAQALFDQAIRHGDASHASELSQLEHLFKAKVQEHQKNNDHDRWRFKMAEKGAAKQNPFYWSQLWAAMTSGRGESDSPVLFDDTAELQKLLGVDD